jgi:hypothetical protein
MNLKQLSNHQLYEIIQNRKLNKDIRTSADNEFNSRRLTKEEILEIVIRRDSMLRPDRDEPLSIKYKIVAVLIPFFWVIHVLMTSTYPARNQNRKWKEYWLFFCIGVLLWTIVVILIGKYFTATRK